MSDFLDKQAQAQKDAADAPAEVRPDIWAPKDAGEQLLGTVEKVAWPYITSASEHRWVLEVKDQAGKIWSVWCGGAVLKRLLIDTMPAIGAEIAITYDGNDQKTKAGYNYKSFQMAASQFDTSMYQRIMVDTRAKQEVRDAAYAGGGAGAGSPGITAPGDDGDVDPW